ncbi:MAG TPA: hypothetical protein VFO16_18475 [Pseudonocardiaceae bacterium]|nr:hypothetical protein [Pseudonocardiaceae bacterium]
MTLDPQADPGRRAWLPCRYCDSDAALYLLGSDVNMVWVQCGACLHRWWHDTNCGHGPRPGDLFDVA